MAGVSSAGSVPFLSGVAFVIMVVVAGWFRLDQLSVKPLHHDEGVNGWFLLRLSNDGEYRYNPDNYHGPTLYYLSLLPVRALGESELALRVTPAFFGLLSVVLLWLLRQHLGSVGTPGAALFMALSAGLVYFSRDFIHEMLFGCFTLSTVIGAVRYVDGRRIRWLALVAASLGLLFATKETSIITLPTLLLALAAAFGFDLLRNGGSPRPWRSLLSESWPSRNHAFAGLLIFFLINLVLYSSFFSHPGGLADAIRSPWRWTGRSGTEHVKGFWYYLAILIKLELPLLLAATTGGLLILWRGTRFWYFVAAWASGMFLAYSLIGYKTPWLVINTLIPMALLAGHSLQRLYDLAGGTISRVVLLLPLMAGLAFSAHITRVINIDHYDDNHNLTGFFAGYGRRFNLALYQDELVGYVYAQTDRELRGLLSLIAHETSMAGDDKGIYVASPDYWPLPWYLRHHLTVDYRGMLPELDSTGNPTIGHRFIIARTDQLDSLVNATAYRVSPTSYHLRPGVNLVLLVRDESKIESERH